MKTRCYLVLNRRGVDRLTKGRPHPTAGEFAVAITLEIPDQAFAQAVAEVQINVPQQAIITPTVTVEGATAVQQRPECTTE